VSVVPAIDNRAPLADPVGSAIRAPISRDGRDRLKVLISAEACNPSWTSVPLVGYNLARALSEREDLEVTLVTNARNRNDLQGDPIHKNADVQFIENDFIAGPVFRLARKLRGGVSMSWSVNTAMMWPGYMVYERMLFRAFRRDLQNGRFDLIHRVTPLTPVLGSPLTSWTNVPMVIGPLNGGLPWPEEYPELRRQEKEWLIPFRRMHQWLPYHRSTFQKAAGLIAASKQTENAFHGYDTPKFYLPENGVNPERFPIADFWRKPDGPYRFITVGRLAPVKVIDLILHAMGGSELLRGCKLTIVGDGPQRESLEAITRQHGLEDNIEFRGWLDQSTLAGCLEKSQAFVFPSVKDFGGGAVLEAMAAALPSIVCNYGGPAELISEETGIVLPLGAADELVVSLRTAMETLAVDHLLSARLGEEAARRVRRDFIWSAKAERIVAYYRQILSRRP